MNILLVIAINDSNPIEPWVQAMIDEIEFEAKEMPTLSRDEMSEFINLVLQVNNMTIPDYIIDIVVRL